MRAQLSGGRLIVNIVGTVAYLALALAAVSAPVLVAWKLPLPPRPVVALKVVAHVAPPTGNALLNGRYLFTSWASGGFESGEFVCDGAGRCVLDSHMSDGGWHLGQWNTVWTVRIVGHAGDGSSTAPQCATVCDVAYIYVNDDGSEFRMIGPSWVAQFARTS